MKHLFPLETRMAQPVETREDDPLAAATAAVEQLSRTAEEHRTAMDERLATELRTRDDRIAALETRLNRPGSSQDNHDDGDTEMRAFLDYARRGVMTAEHRALDSGTADAGGGYTVPETFSAELLRNIVQFSPIRSVARVMTIAGGSVKLPKRTGTMTADWVDEGDDSDETSPTFAQVNVAAHEARCYTDISNQLLEDSGLDLAAELAFDAAEEFGRLEGISFVKGTGTGQPSGIITDTAVAAGAKLTGAASTLGTAPADLLIDLFYSLKPFYRANATWGMNGTTLAAVRKLKDTTTGQFLWQPGLQAGQPDTLLGRPVIELPDMDDVGAGKFPIILGDFMQGYRIVDRIALSSLRDPYSAAVSSQTRFHWRKRVGGAVVKAEAFKALKVAAS
ncbi:phage major capsid protein [Pelagibacterium mangrovi]|uniref:phage major capsid protein n=1 Tax=Pelagibacterium mangrovi TaxID=3119828 RepID=UPI002FC9B04A